MPSLIVPNNSDNVDHLFLLSVETIENLGNILFRTESEVLKLSEPDYQELYYSLIRVVLLFFLGHLAHLRGVAERLNIKNLLAIEYTEQWDKIDVKLKDKLIQVLKLFREKISEPVWQTVTGSEVGQVYEQLLEQFPVIDGPEALFRLQLVASHKRKTTGSYYTPPELIEQVLATALEPLLAKALKSSDPERALLEIRVCDPSCGSGNFLIGAARMIAGRVWDLSLLGSAIFTDKTEIFKEVIGHCVYGVDKDELAVELCRYSLLLELGSGHFKAEYDYIRQALDNHIKKGNSLLGTAEGLWTRGFPDKAFLNGISGDDKEVCKALKKELSSLTYKESTGDLEQDILRANAACAAFVIPKTRKSAPIVRAILKRAGFQGDKEVKDPPGIMEEIKKERKKYSFFHWSLEFAEIFGDRGGFDGVIGNPPWDIQELKDNEFFANCCRDILSVESARDKAAILDSIKKNRPGLYKKYQEQIRDVQTQKHFFKHSGRFPWAAFGRLNLSRLFLECFHSIVRPGGMVGIILPSSFASDSLSQRHFSYLHSKGFLLSLYDFENHNPFFVGVDRRYKFCLLTLCNQKRDEPVTDFVFYARQLSELKSPERRVRLSPDELEILNPVTRTAPCFQLQRDKQLTLEIHKRCKILSDKSSGWRLKPTPMFIMNARLQHHRSAGALGAEGLKLIGNRFYPGESKLDTEILSQDIWYPLYEGKMVGMYNHRSANIVFREGNRVRRNQAVSLDTENLRNPDQMAMPMFWVSGRELERKCGTIPKWSVVVKDIGSATNERTVIAAVLPTAAISHTLLWFINSHSPLANACLLACLNSFALDYVARQKIAGLHLGGHYLAQLPLLPREIFDQGALWTGTRTVAQWIVPKVVELTCTARDISRFAVQCGVSGAPFLWDDMRRLKLRCVLDAAFFHLYGLDREKVSYILSLFSTVARKEQAKYGRFLSREMILKNYDLLGSGSDWDSG